MDIFATTVPAAGPTKTRAACTLTDDQNPKQNKADQKYNCAGVYSLCWAYLFKTALRARLKFSGISNQQFLNPSNARNNTAHHVTCLKCGNNIIAHDLACEHVSQHTLQAIANFDTNFAFVGRDQQDHAIIETLALTNLPRAPQSIAIFFNLVTLQAGDCCNNKLV